VYLLQFSGIQGYVLDCENESYFHPNLESISEISTKNCQLKNITIETFGGERTDKLTSLRVLDLTNNQLTEIQDYQFSRASKITSLKLSNNSISSLSRKSFYGLGYVEHLFLDRNCLTEIYLDDFVLSRLSWLNVGDNKISEVKTIKKLEHSLTSLDIYDNQLKDISNLKELKSIKRLNIGHNPQIVNLTSTVSEFSDLTHLYLTATNLNESNNFQFLSKLTKLVYLNLMQNDLGNIFFTTFPSLPNLEVLNIRDNKLTKIFYQVLEEKFRDLIKIQITDNDWDCDFLEAMLYSFTKSKIQLSYEYASNIRNPKKKIFGMIECYGSETKSLNIEHAPFTNTNANAYISWGLSLLSISLTVSVLIFFCCSNSKKNETELNKTELNKTELNKNVEDIYETFHAKNDHYEVI
jgi:Leucine-rich repeat (LRR) protein